MIVDATAETLRQAVALLRHGRLVAFPTETVYGLGANAWDEQAVNAIFRAKGRPANNPLIVHVASRERLTDAVAADLPVEIERALDRLSALWPGPLSVVLPKHAGIGPAVTAGLPTVAVRIPNHPVALDLLAACPFPIAAPSANRSNYVSPTSAAHVQDGLGDRVAMILDGGRCECGLESTIVSLVESPPRLLRFGAVPAEVIAKQLAIPFDALLRAAAALPADETSAQLSPGRLPVHYSPRTPLVLRDGAGHDLARASRAGLIAFSEEANTDSRFVRVEILSRAGDLEEIGRRLFAAIRDMDAAGLDLIVVDTCDEVGLGRTIMDRLRRAAAPAR